MKARSKKPVRQRPAAPEVLADKIRSYIAYEQLGVGAHMPTQAIADRFMVSRFPVHQAMAQLCKAGTLVHRKNQGYFVAKVPSKQESYERVAGAPTDLSAAYFRIAEDRLKGVIGEQVTESFLRDKYKLTRDQLSDLLIRISHEGWAERRPGYGWQFSPILTTPEALEQSYRVRMAIEPAYLLEPGFRLEKQAAAQCRDMEKWLLAGAIETISADALYERGVRFHETLAAASGNPFFLDTLRRINRIRRLLVYRSLGDRSRYYTQAKEHLKLLDLLEADRNEEAAQLMKRHLSGVSENLKKNKKIMVR